MAAGCIFGFFAAIGTTGAGLPASSGFGASRCPGFSPKLLVYSPGSPSDTGCVDVGGPSFTGFATSAGLPNTPDANVFNERGAAGGGPAEASPPISGPKILVNSPAFWKGRFSLTVVRAALACSPAMSMARPESPLPNSLVNSPVSSARPARAEDAQSTDGLGGGGTSCLGGAGGSPGGFGKRAGGLARSTAFGGAAPNARVKSPISSSADVAGVVPEGREGGSIRWKSPAASSSRPGGSAADRKSTRLNSSHLGISYAV